MKTRIIILALLTLSFICNWASFAMAQSTNTSDSRSANTMRMQNNQQKQIKPNGSKESSPIFPSIPLKFQEKSRPKRVIIILEIEGDAPVKVVSASVIEEKESKEEGWDVGIGAGFGFGKVKKTPKQEEIQKICEEVTKKTGLKCSIRYEDDMICIEARPQ